MGTLALLIVVAIIFVIYMASAVRQNAIPKGDGQEIFDPKGIDRGMALVVYQPSKGDFLDKTARLIAKELYRNGYKVVLDHPSIDLSNDVQEYDIIVLGSRVYVGQMSELILDYARQLPSLKYKTCGLFSSGALEATPEFTELEAILKGNPRIVTTKFVIGNIASPEDRARDFVGDLISPERKNI